MGAISSLFIGKGGSTIQKKNAVSTSLFCFGLNVRVDFKLCVLPSK